MQPDVLQLYVVTDESSSPSHLQDTLRKAMVGGCTAIQLRRKAVSGREFVQLGHALRSLTREWGCLFLVNDRVDVALAVDADGVHVGQDDIPCRDVRRLMRDKWIGVSASTVEEAKQAERDGADYLGVGALFPTRSKADATPTPLPGLRAIAEAVRMPIVGIGGIERQNAASVIEHGAAGIAVVSAIMSAPDPEWAARTLKQEVTRSLAAR